MVSPPSVAWWTNVVDPLRTTLFLLAVGCLALPLASADVTGKPLPPTGLQATYTPGGVQLTWSPPLASPDPVTSYVVYRVNGTTHETLAEVDASVTSYLDTGADPAYPNAYYVTAVAGHSESAPSNAAITAYPYCWDIVTTTPPFLNSSCISPIPGIGPVQLLLQGSLGNDPLGVGGLP